VHDARSSARNSAWRLFEQIPQEYAPQEDPGAFFVLVNGLEGASFGYMEEYMDEIERRLLPYAESGEAIRVLMRTPRGFGADNYRVAMTVALAAGDARGVRVPPFDDTELDLGYMLGG
jgi:multidrug efflux pump